MGQFSFSNYEHKRSYKDLFATGKNEIEIKCKYRHDNNKYKDCECYLGHTNSEDDLLMFKYLNYDKNYQIGLINT